MSLRYCFRRATTYDDAIIAIIENQRGAGYCSAHLVAQTRWRGTGSRQHKFGICGSVRKLLTGSFAARLLQVNIPAGHNLRDLTTRDISIR